ncbi:DnaJ domain containing protein [Tritrichomonas foetus]|uniref:DnaJ domain containing protein n=1 Tax=Tritrichomonas foetus TaxID=1144522 RepID=A0A1J4JNH5_9EUKA|nr:DnaJ domain containing protein [Tritrichomonas foetus]|eukprot:OHS98812.1 DnaJ domain containing protein [Tritrichomonas foetus]
MFWSLLFTLSLIHGDGNRDFYHVLGLKHDCTEREIDRSFQKLSRKYHPDKNKGNAKAAELFTNINDAYAALKDPQKRRVYDLYGEQGLHLYESPKNELNDILGLTRSDSPDNSAAIVRKKGKTYRIVFPVDLVDFYTSSHYKFLVTRRNMCRCPQAGFFCAKCHGRPTIRENVTLSLFVEKGSDEGTVVLFKNAGDTTEMNAPSDIEVEIISKPHPLFRRDGANLHMSIELTLKEALLGFQRTFTFIDGSELIVESKEPLGCGKLLTIPQKGLPKYLYPGEYGDLIVHTSLKWPKSLSTEQRERVANALDTKK